MTEGSLEAPTRHTIPWQDERFYDEAETDAELRRVFDICHGCRRCFNLCDSFPRLFDLIDDSDSGELDSVDSKDFKPVIDACTLCDMCFMTKCPYVPPHEFDLDFPHLMLRYRAIEHRKGATPWTDKQLTQTDRNGKLAGLAAPVTAVANWASRETNSLTRPIMEKVAHIHRDAALPKFHADTFIKRAAKQSPTVNRNAPGFGRKAVLYATCYGNYNNPEIGAATQAVLAHNGVETEIIYPKCCGMPQLEQGDIAGVAANAADVAAQMAPWIEKGYDVIGLVPSCSLMLKFEWPLIVPDNDAVQTLAAATKDVSEYIVDIAKDEGLADGLGAMEGGVTVHIACHARAQNMGQKAAELLRLLPDTDIQVIERCSGHGGSWGVMKDNFDVALKIGKPVARQVAKAPHQNVVSECPLAGLHIGQGVERLPDAPAAPNGITVAPHPIVLFAKAYGLSS
jgi:glycerol-3-phosphate dehydrogenase subunit C